MSTKRRWAGAFVLMAVAVMTWLVAFRGDTGAPPIQLIFLGFTNLIVSSRDTLPDFRTAHIYETRARLLITNVGSGPVVFDAQLAAFGSNGGPATYSRGIPRPIPILKTRESVVLEFGNPSNAKRVRIQAAYVRWNLRRRWADRLSKSSVPFIRDAARKTLGRLQFTRVSFDELGEWPDDPNYAPRFHPTPPVPLNLPTGPQ